MLKVFLKVDRHSCEKSVQKWAFYHCNLGLLLNICIPSRTFKALFSNKYTCSDRVHHRYKLPTVPSCRILLHLQAMLFRNGDITTEYGAILFCYCILYRKMHRAFQRALQTFAPLCISTRFRARP